ncbi:TetR/AcrR family transcriptional regulator [Mesorhizobium muleiense]|uniref:TetR/AcrR family transcriptional regulator n=1 Tax=Mesorhizobium muleiense TaxID=1004279 RepID=UPI003AFA9A95
MNHPVGTRTDPDEVRARILEVAEAHFRRIGYHKTSVADIASELGMSRANVYRFFSSRDAINESICRQVVNEVADIAVAIARTNAPALEKLDRLLTAVLPAQQDEIDQGKKHARLDRRRPARESGGHQGACRANVGNP